MSASESVDMIDAEGGENEDKDADSEEAESVAAAAASSACACVCAFWRARSVMARTTLPRTAASKSASERMLPAGTPPPEEAKDDATPWMLRAGKDGLALSADAARDRSDAAVIPTAAAAASAAAAGKTGSYAALGASQVSHTEAYDRFSNVHARHDHGK